MEYKFLPNLIGKVRASLGGGGSPVSHAISGSTAATSGPYGGAFTAFGGGWDVEQSVIQGLERVIWVQRCIDAIASNQAKLKFIIRKGDPETGKIIKNDDLNYTLNRRPNTYETAKQFRYRLSAQLLLSKRGAFIEKQRSESGRYRLHLLPPQNVEPIPDPEKFVAGYRLMTANDGEVILRPEQVIWLRLKPHPIDPYLQLTPLTAAGLAIETDFLARLFNRNFLLNDGRPGMLINIAGQIGPRDAEEIKQRFSGNPHTAGRVSVIESDGITVNDLGASPRDLQWLEAITGTKSDILLAFGTPESVLGNASGRTYDNADAEKEVWWEETMIPHCDPIGSGLDLLTGSYDDDEFLTFDYDSVDVLQRRKRARHQTLIQGFGQGVNTLDEVLEGTGREKWDIPATRVLFHPNGIVIGKAEEDVEAVAQLPTVGVEQQADIAAEAQRGAQMGAELGQRNFGNMISARATRIANGEDQYGGPRQEDYALAKHYDVTAREMKILKYMDSLEGDWTEEDEVKEHPYGALRAEAEANFDLFLTDWSHFQEETILGRLEHRKARQYTRHWEGEVKAAKPLNAKYVVDTSRWATGIQEGMERLLTKVTRDALKEAAEEMQASGITRAMFAMGQGNASGRSALMKVFGDRAGVEDSVRELLSPFNDVVAQAAANQSARVMKVIQDMDAEGASMTQIKQQVQRMMSTRGSWRQGLSTALTTSIIEAARFKAFNEAGEIVNKIWNTVQDEHVRPTHMAADGDEVPIGTAFKIGKSRMNYPGDPQGEIGERINCRCYTDYVISPEAEELYDLTAGEY